MATTLLLLGILLAVVLVAFNVPLGGSTDAPGARDLVLGSPLLDKPAPDFALVDLSTGQTVRLSDERGHPVIVNFWASWCVPCREEFPEFVSAIAQYGKAQGLAILGIVHEDSADAAIAFAQQRGAGWPLLADSDNVAWKAYQGLGVPSTYFIDAQGVVRATSLGPVTASALPVQLAKILGPSGWLRGVLHLPS